MKRKILMVMMAVVFLAGCATVGPIPKEDVIIFVPTPVGIIPIMIKKGHFDNPDSYFTRDEWNKFQKKQEENQKKHQLNNDGERGHG